MRGVEQKSRRKFRVGRLFYLRSDGLEVEGRLLLDVADLMNKVLVDHRPARLLAAQPRVGQQLSKHRQPLSKH